MIEQFVQIIQVILDITAYLIRIIAELHLTFGQFDGLVDVELMFFDEFLLLFEDELDVLVVFLGELGDVELLGVLASAHVVVCVGGVCRRRGLPFLGGLRVDGFDWDGLGLDWNSDVTPVSQGLAILSLYDFRLIFVLGYRDGWLRLQIEPISRQHELLL